MGVSENRGTLFWGSLKRILLIYYLGYYIRIPYFRKLPYALRHSRHLAHPSGIGLRVKFLSSYALADTEAPTLT